MAEASRGLSLSSLEIEYRLKCTSIFVCGHHFTVKTAGLLPYRSMASARTRSKEYARSGEARPTFHETSTLRVSSVSSNTISCPHSLLPSMMVPSCIFCGCFHRSNGERAVSVTLHLRTWVSESRSRRQNPPTDDSLTNLEM